MSARGRRASRTTAEAESSGARDRLSEERRTQVAHRVAKIRVIEKVQEVNRDRQVITAVRRTSASKVSTAIAAAPAATSSTPTAAAASASSSALRPTGRVVYLSAEAEIAARA